MNILNNLTDATTISTASDAQSESLYYDNIRENIITYTSPILLVFGLMGNSLILVVILRREIGHLPPGPYLAALAIADIVVLGAGLTELWLYYGFDIDMRITDIGYKLIVFVVYSSVFSSAWLVVAVTVDRFVSICFPFGALKIRRTHRIGAALTTVILCMCINVHFLIFLNTKAMNTDYVRFLKKTLSIVFFLFASAIPFAVIVLCNIGIIAVTSLSRRLRGASLDGGQRNSQIEHTKRDDAHLTTLLMTLNVVFIVTTGPVSIYIIYISYIPQPTDEVKVAHQKLILAVLNMWTYVNNTFNFVLYSVTGKRFRTALLSLLRCRQAVDDMSIVHVSNTTAQSLS